MEDQILFYFLLINVFIGKISFLPAILAISPVVLVNRAISCVFHTPFAPWLAPPEELSAGEAGDCPVVKMVACAVTTDSAGGGGGGGGGGNLGCGFLYP